VEKNANGRAWARFWLIVALLVSVTANVTHTVLADSEITLLLRVPGAVVWPMFTFAGIEILVRIIWERRWTHSIARNVLLAAAVPAAITSYEHQYTLLGMMGEDELIQIIGPLAIDGLMIGCTMALLFTREQAEKIERIQEIDVDATLAKWDVVAEAERAVRESSGSSAALAPESDAGPLLVHSESESPGTVEIAAPLAVVTEPRAPRAGSEALEKAIRALLDGQGVKEAAEAHGVGRSTLQRYETVRNRLRDDALAVIDTKSAKVRPELVELMRGELRMERAR